jgi:hypothetical protein
VYMAMKLVKPTGALFNFRVSGKLVKKMR